MWSFVDIDIGRHSVASWNSRGIEIKRPGGTDSPSPGSIKSMYDLLNIPSLVPMTVNLNHQLDGIRIPWKQAFRWVHL